MWILQTKTMTIAGPQVLPCCYFQLHSNCLNVVLFRTSWYPLVPSLHFTGYTDCETELESWACKRINGMQGILSARTLTAYGKFPSTYTRVLCLFFSAWKLKVRGRDGKGNQIICVPFQEYFGNESNSTVETELSVTYFDDDYYNNCCSRFKTGNCSFTML